MSALLVAFELPLRLQSLANIRKHWTGRARLAKDQRALALMATRGRITCLTPTGRVRITRIGPRTLDTDNLAISAKHVRDGIADAFGLDDADPRFAWEYAQERRKTYGVRVEVF